jgi:predicted nuclease of restriction endonuclease-like RecB superfamily
MMSFRLVDLKKSVRKGREGYQVTPARLEGRPAAFRIEFLLQQFEGHLGCPRRMLDPNSLLEFVGDARLGRGLLAALSQWYRMRSRSFTEVLEDGGARLREHGIAGPIDLRAWLYAAVNRGGQGYLDPDTEPLFWKSPSRALGFRRQDLQKLMLLDRPEEAVLVRTGPPPTAADVMAAYNARALTTLLRSAVEVELRCEAPPPLLERAARAWADPLEVEWRAEAGALRLLGRADALGCWTRHGRRVERAALELLALPELAARELRGRLEIGERRCQFRWTSEALSLLGAGQGGSLGDGMPDRITALAADLRRERDRNDDRAWRIRRPSHLLGVEGGVFLPHLELRRGDLAVYLRLAEPSGEESAAVALAPFRRKTPVARVSGSGEAESAVLLQFAGEKPERCAPGDVLSTLAARLEHLRAATPAGLIPTRRQPERQAA